MEAGAPRKNVYDTAGLSVVPLNRASRGEKSHHRDDPLEPQPSGQHDDRYDYRVSGWPKEVKPTLGDAAHDGAVLMHMARTTDEPIFVWGDDFASFFHQFACCSADHWKMCVLLLPL